MTAAPVGASPGTCCRARRSAPSLRAPRLPDSSARSPRATEARPKPRVPRPHCCTPHGRRSLRGDVTRNTGEPFTLFVLVTSVVQQPSGPAAPVPPRGLLPRSCAHGPDARRRTDAPNAPVGRAVPRGLFPGSCAHGPTHGDAQTPPRPPWPRRPAWSPSGELRALPTHGNARMPPPPLSAAQSCVVSFRGAACTARPTETHRSPPPPSPLGRAVPRGLFPGSCAQGPTHEDTQMPAPPPPALGPRPCFAAL